MSKPSGGHNIGCLNLGCSYNGLLCRLCKPKTRVQLPYGPIHVDAGVMVAQVAVDDSVLVQSQCIQTV